MVGRQGALNIPYCFCPADCAFNTPKREAGYKCRRRSGIDALVIPVVEGKDFAPYFDQAVAGGAQAVQLIQVAYFHDHADALAALALARKLPTVGPGYLVPNGTLVGYNANIDDAIRRAGSYVDAILKGSKPSDLPVEQPEVFDFVVNLKTAAALGITIPQSVLYQATQVIM